MGKFLGLALALVLFGQSAQAFESHKGFIEISPGKQLYVDYIPPATGQELLVLGNGLTNSTENWNEMMPGLINKGFGILRYDAMGQGRTLQKYGNPPNGKSIPIEDQAKDLALLLKALNIRKASVAGLSYGGGLALQFAAMFPQLVTRLILLPPFIAPLPKQDAFIKSEIAYTRMMFPLNPLTDEQLYDYYLHNFILTTFPISEPDIMQHPYLLESTYRMTLGIRKMKYEYLVPKIPNTSVNLMVALQDEYIPYEMLDKFWNDIPANKRVSRININGSKHRMNESIPQYAAAWIVEIMHKNPEISQSREFYGNASSGTAKCGNILIKLVK